MGREGDFNLRLKVVVGYLWGLGMEEVLGVEGMGINLLLVDLVFWDFNVIVIF